MMKPEIRLRRVRRTLDSHCDKNMISERDVPDGGVVPYQSDAARNLEYRFDAADNSLGMVELDPAGCWVGMMKMRNSHREDDIPVGVKMIILL